MKSIIALVVLGFMGQFAIAHEGHNHDAPSVIQAPKGGVIKALDESRVEVVSSKKNVKVYVYDKAMKPADASTFKILAKAELPRTKKIENIKLEAKNGFLEGVYDAKGVHRYTLKLAVTDPKTGRTDNLTFTIEPRK